MSDQGLALRDHHFDGAIADLTRYLEAPLSCRGQDTGLQSCRRHSMPPVLSARCAVH